ASSERCSAVRNPATHVRTARRALPAEIVQVRRERGETTSADAKMFGAPRHCRGAPNDRLATERQEFGPRSIDTGCHRRRPDLSSTPGFTQERGQRPVNASAISAPTRRRRTGPKPAEAEATGAGRI